MIRGERRRAKERHTQAYLLLKQEIDTLGGLPKMRKGVTVKHEGEPKRRSESDPKQKRKQKKK